MKKYFPILILFLLLPLILARAHSIPSAELTYQLNEDGKINVTERITYNLEGNFTELYRQLPPDMKLSGENGHCLGKKCQFYTQMNNGYFELVLKSNYSDEKITIVFNYVIEDQILGQKDCAQFFYKLWGNEWEKSIGLLEATVLLPKNSDKTTHFIHPISDNIKSTEDKNSILIISKNHPAKTYLEINLLMPKEMFSGIKNAKNYMSKNEIIQIEEKEIDKNKTLMKYSEIISVFGVFLIFLIPIFFIYIYLKNGRERPIKELGFFGPYEHEPPEDISPALAYYIINFSENSDLIVAEILYLVNKKYLHMSEIKVETKTFFGTKKEKRCAFQVNGLMGADKLNAYQREILAFIKNNLVSKEGKKYFFFEEIRPNSMRSTYKSFVKAVEDEFKKLSYLDTSMRNKSAKIATWFLSILAFYHFRYVFFPKEIVDQTFIIFLILFTESSIILLLSLSRPDILGKWSDTGRIANHRWNNFRRYLNDETLMKEKKPMDIIIWEKYLIYATAFGVSKKVLKALKMVSPDASKSEMLRNPVFIGTALASMSSSASSASGTSRGGGGAGGGGGGGGGGAR